MKPISDITTCRRMLWVKCIPLTLLLLVTFVAPGSAWADAQVINIQLSGDMLTEGGVYIGHVSPDGARVVFIGDLEFNGMSELYSVATRGGPRMRLSGDHLINGGNVVSDFQIAPNSERVVFRADKDVNDMVELWTVPIAGGAPVRLSQGLTFNQDVTGFKIAPDSRYVVYTVTTGDGAPVNIYSVPIEGGWQAKLNGDVGASGRAFDVEISAGSEWVVYQMQNDGETVHNLYSAPIYGSITGTDRIRLNGAPVADAAGVSVFEITPNGARVVYRARQDRINTPELYSVPIRGPTNSEIKLIPDLPDYRSVQAYRITPDSSRVVYLADQETDVRADLYSVPTTGGAAPIRITDMITFSYADGEVHNDFEITPNSLGVVFRVNPTYGNTHDLYGATLDGTTWRKYNPTLASGQTVSNFAITPNGLGVVFRSDFSGRYQLYSIDMLANLSLLPLTNAGSGALVGGYFKITPNSQHVVYVGSMETPGVFEMYSFPIRGVNFANTLKWNAPFHLSESDVNGFVLLPDSKSLVFTADTEIDEQLRIYYAFYGYPLYLPHITR